ncbi:GGDEF domain-containing protein [Metabacillus sp. RGM 3146]|uniref:GGDEF domain-containing protein n=1 Tax=Metabacillus sp. RGM 3146 TaxID=3401092 RepID=UPI003B99EC68
MIKIGDIIDQVPSVHIHTKSSEVNGLFEDQHDLEGIVVTQSDAPIGLVMKSHFYQKLSSKYGYDLFMGRSIELVMDKQPLIVDYFESLTKVSSLAMERLQEHLYDYVIVTLNNRLAGVVSIKTLLIKFAEVQVNIATYTNPLSGLPGNVLIENQLTEIIAKNEPFTFLYTDLDHFKTYNDTYGFNKGDLLIKETASILNKYILLNGTENAFVGHIGGDDFVAILPHYEFESVCESIIKEYSIRLKQFYDPSDWERGSIYTVTRDNRFLDIPLVALSIAVVTNEDRQFKTVEELSGIAAKTKKQCKTNPTSCFVRYIDAQTTV